MHNTTAKRQADRYLCIESLDIVGTVICIKRGHSWIRVRHISYCMHTIRKKSPLGGANEWAHYYILKQNVKVSSNIYSGFVIMFIAIQYK